MIQISKIVSMMKNIKTTTTKLLELVYSDATVDAYAELMEQLDGKEEKLDLYELFACKSRILEREANSIGLHWIILLNIISDNRDAKSLINDLFLESFFKNINQFISNQKVYEAPANGKYAGLSLLLLLSHPTILYLLASMDEGKGFLRDFTSQQQDKEFVFRYLDLLEKANFDASPASGKDVGKTLLWQLAFGAGIEVLIANPQFLLKGNLNASPSRGKDAGKSIFWLLASHPNSVRLLSENAKLLDNADANIYPLEGDQVGTNFVWQLAKSHAGRSLLRTKPQLLVGSLHVGPLAGEQVGGAVLSLLTQYEDGQQILLENLDLLDQVNMDTPYLSGVFAGQTPLLFLAKTATGQEILAKKMMLLHNGNIDACALKGKDKGKTPLWYLASTSVGLKILRKNPKLLLNGNVNAISKAGKDAGKSVIWILSLTVEGRAILMEHPQVLTSANLNTMPGQGNGVGKTAYHLLAENIDSREFIFQQQSLLTSENLQTAISSQGDSPIGYLVEYSKTLLISAEKLVPFLLALRKLNLQPAFSSLLTDEKDLPLKTLCMLAETHVQLFRNRTLIEKIGGLFKPEPSDMYSVFAKSMELLSSTKLPKDIAVFVSYYFLIEHYPELKMLSSEIVLNFIMHLEQQIFLEKMASLVVLRLKKMIKAEGLKEQVVECLDGLKQDCRRYFSDRDARLTYLNSFESDLNKKDNVKNVFPKTSRFFKELKESQYGTLSDQDDTPALSKVV